MSYNEHMWEKATTKTTTYTQDPTVRQLNHKTPEEFSQFVSEGFLRFVYQYGSWKKGQTYHVVDLAYMMDNYISAMAIAFEEML